MKLLSVNVSLPKEVSYQGNTVRTGIFKKPVQGRVQLNKLNLAGDGQADLRVHGGIHKAVYAYPIENYDYWKQQLQRDDFSYGQFGENFTVQGMLEDQVHIGDIFRIGTALVEISQPRVPCFKLGIKMGSQKFLRMFLLSERSGFYFKVLEEDQVGADDPIERVQEGPEKMSVREIHHLYHFDKKNLIAARRALKISALAPGWCEGFQKIVEKNSG